MSQAIILHELPPSPNNLKVRMALGFKGIPYTRKPLEMSEAFGDRSEIIALSGQPRTPVLQHGETVMFDSNGIIRYLEANVKREPSLFTTDYAEFGELEKWEQFARTRMSPSIGALFGMALSDGGSPAANAEANASFYEVTGELEEHLSGRDFLVCDRTTSADLAVVAVASLAVLTDSAAEQSPLLGYFKKNLQLGEGREKTRAWIERHLAYDNAS